LGNSPLANDTLFPLVGFLAVKICENNFLPSSIKINITILRLFLTFLLGKSTLALFDYLDELPPTSKVFLPENHKKKYLIEIVVVS